MKVNLIGIHGPLNGGKDTVANLIQEMLPDVFGRYAFAKPIKEACMVMFGFTLEQLEDRVLKEQVDPFWDFTPRRAMQLLGTEYGRNMLRKDIWIKRAELEHLKNLKAEVGTIITDVRFPNEAEWLRTQPNAALIYLQVPWFKKDERFNHESEAGIELDRAFDNVVYNDKVQGLEPLRKQLRDLMF